MMIVEINGHRYRYEYDSSTKKTKYLGPVGEAPLSEKDFHRVFIEDLNPYAQMADFLGADEFSYAQEDLTSVWRRRQATFEELDTTGKTLIGAHPISDIDIFVEGVSVEQRWRLDEAFVSANIMYSTNIESLQRGIPYSTKTTTLDLLERDPDALWEDILRRIKKDVELLVKEQLEEQEKER